MQNNQSAIQVLRIKEVVQITGISRSSIYEMLNERSSRHDPTFPKRVRIGVCAVGWLRHEIEAWILSKKA